MHDMQPFITELNSAQVGDILFDEPLAKHTTWKIGGPADVLIVPSGKEQLVKTVKLLHKHGIPWTTIGRGSNLLVMDKGIRGVVIKLGKGLDDLHFEDTTIRVGGAYSFVTLSIKAGKEGLTGLEYAGGIPGSVGGAVYMNAGAHGSDVSRIFKEAEIVLETGELVRYSASEMQFSYRHSILHEVRGIVLEATFVLEHGDRKEIAAALASYKDRRLKTQPLQLPCCGSVFRNPPNDYSARLIEEAGLKGYRVGGAEISTLHANFIVNTGQATARDVLTLIDEIKQTIQSKYGISLVPEVLMMGER